MSRCVRISGNSGACHRPLCGCSRGTSDGHYSDYTTVGAAAKYIHRRQARRSIVRASLSCVFVRCIVALRVFARHTHKYTLVAVSCVELIRRARRILMGDRETFRPTAMTLSSRKLRRVVCVCAQSDVSREIAPSMTSMSADEDELVNIGQVDSQEEIIVLRSSSSI